MSLPKPATLPVTPFPELDIEGVPVPVSKAPAADKVAEVEAETESVRATVAFGQKNLRSVTIPGELLEGLSGEERMAAARRIAMQQAYSPPYPGPRVAPLGGVIRGGSRRTDALFIAAQDVKEIGPSRLANFRDTAEMLGLVLEADFDRDGYILRRRGR